MSIVTGIGAPMASVIIALCVLFVIGVGIGERRRLKKAYHKVYPTEIENIGEIEEKKNAGECDH